MVEGSIDNKTVKSKSKLNDFLEEHFSSKEISSDHDYPFNFKNANWYITITYLVSFIIIPIVYSLVKTYVFHISWINGKLPSSWIGIESVMTFLIPIIGIAIALAVDWHAMTKKGAWAAYTHFIFNFVSVIFVSIFAIKSHSKTLAFLIQTIFQFIGSLIVIFLNKALRKQIIATLKEAKLDLLVWVLITAAIVLWLNFIFDLMSKNINSSNFLTKDSSNKSQNQKNLEAMAAAPFGIFVLILSAGILAPINEEISYRYGIFSIVRHKWLAFAASLIYFPAMHIMDYGDWDKISGYLVVSIMIPLLFICTRGNTTYTIALHILMNVIVISKIFIK